MAGRLVMFNAIDALLNTGQASHQKGHIDDTIRFTNTLMQILHLNDAPYVAY